jgi:hypothetical protein
MVQAIKINAILVAVFRTGTIETTVKFPTLKKFPTLTNYKTVLQARKQSIQSFLALINHGPSSAERSAYVCTPAALS